MTSARLSVQPAYLLNCLDKVLSLQMDAIIQMTTPIIGGGVNCLSLLTGLFERKYPLLLGRKNFFDMQQGQGQDERAFADGVVLAGTEANVAGMPLDDALCLVILSGTKDSRLREKMSELEMPNLASFNVLIDAHMHAKATQVPAATALYTQGRGGYRGGRGGSSGRGGQSNQGNRGGPSDAEK